MYYGASYYPEHKTSEELEHDIELLSQSGINTVRMGEFAWCRICLLYTSDAADEL